MVCDTLQQVLILQATYTYLVSDFGNFLLLVYNDRQVECSGIFKREHANDRVESELPFTVILNGLVCCLAQILFVHRAYHCTCSLHQQMTLAEATSCSK